MKIIITKKILIISSIAVSIIGLVLIFYGIFGGDKKEYEQVTVAREDVVQNVSVTGTVIAAKQIDLQFETQGRVDEIAVKVGDSVTTGQLLIKLDTGELSAQLQAYQASLSLARAKLAKTLAGNREEDIKVYESALEKAEITLANAEQTLIDTQEDADNDLEQAYEDALDTLRTVYTKMDSAITVVFAGMQEEYFNSSSQLDYGVQYQGDRAKEDLAMAKTYLDAAEASFNYSDIDTALNRVQTALTTTRNALAHLRTAMDDDSVIGVSSTDKTSVDTERTTIDTQIVNATTAKQDISTTKITNQANLNSAQGDVEAAQASLQKAQNELTLIKAEPREEDIELAQAEVDKASADVRQIQEKISKRIMLSPMDGIVTAIEKEIGEITTSGSVVLSMIGADRFQIEANISETEIARVNIGDKVDITLDALGPEEKFEGQIIEVDPAETVISGVIYYKVTSVFNVNDERIKSGMTANLDIRTAVKENVLSLPYYVIQRDNGRRYVYVINDKRRVEERDLEIGLEGEMKVEIKSGLKEGDVVVIEK